MKAQPIQASFASGEVSPKIGSRVDLTRYGSSLKECKNFVVMPQGGVTRRPGTIYTATVKNSAKRVQLVPFEFSIDQAYILEFGHNYIRFFKNGAPILSAGVPYEVVTTYTEDEVHAINFAQSADVLFLAHPSHPPAQLSRFSDTSWTLADCQFLDGPYLSENTTETELDAASSTGSSVIITASSTVGINNGAGFSAADIGRPIRFRDSLENNPVNRTGTITSVRDGAAAGLGTQYAGLVVFSSSANALATGQAVTIYGATGVPYKANGTWEAFSISGSPSFFGISGSSTLKTITGAVNGTSNRIRLTIVNHKLVAGNTLRVDSIGGVTGWVNNVDYVAIIVDSSTIELTGTTFGGTYTSGGVGRITSSFTVVASWETSHISGWAKITGVNNAQSVTASIQSPIATASTPNWRLGAWSASLGYPACVGFYEQRLVFANSASQPQTFWMSNSADYLNFAPTSENSVVGDSNAITYAIASGRLDSINWINPGPTLVMGTSGSEYEIKAASLAEPLSPTNIRAVRQSNFGSKKNVRSLRIGSSVLYAQRSGEAIREMTYDYGVDAHVSRELSLLSEHLFRRDGIREMAYQLEPSSCVWVVTEAGKLAGCTYIKDQEMIGFHSHTLGGSFGSGEAIVESVACIPDSTTGLTQVWLSVKRTINGSTVRYIERMADPFDPTATGAPSTAFYVDCGLSYNGSPATTISGLGHLIGQTVSVLADGAVVPDKVVSGGGTITLDLAASVVHVGLPVTARIRTMNLEAGAQFGTAQAKVKRISKLALSLYNTVGGKAGPDTDSLDPFEFRSPDAPMGEATPIYSGFKEMDFDDDYGYEGVMVVVQDQPLPMTILSVLPKLKTND